MGKKTSKVSEAEFEDLFEDDDLEGDEEEFDEDEDDGDDEEFGDDDDGEEEDEEEEDEEELEDDIDEAVDNSLSNSNVEVLEAIAALDNKLESLLKTVANLAKTPAAKPAAPTKEKAEAPAGEKKRGRGRPPGSKNKPKEEEAPAPAKKAKGGVGKKEAAAILALMNSKPRKGTDATKFARVMSKKKFEGSVTADQIMEFLKENKHVNKAGNFKN